MKRWWLWAWVALAVASAPGCKVFDDSLLPSEGTDAGPVNTGCTNGSNTEPPPPAADTNGPSMAEPIVFALNEAVLNDATAGLNVDGLCTDTDGPWGCLPEKQLGKANPNPILDFDSQGSENQFSNKIFAIVNVGFGAQDLQLTSQTAEAKGYGNPIIEVRDWDGDGNDPRVTVTVTQAVFGVRGATKPDICVVNTANGGVPHEKDPTTGCSPPGPEIPPLDVVVGTDSIETYDPGWDAGDIWFWVRSDTYLTPDITQPTVVDDQAYITDWSLVVHLPDNVLFKLVGEGQAVQAKLTDAVAVGKIKQDLSGTEPGAILVAGRWSIVALLETAGSVGICPGNTLYNSAFSLLSDAADVRSTPGTEAEDIKCDALSMGIKFTGYRAHIADVAPGQPIPNPCGDGGM